MAEMPNSQVSLRIPWATLLKVIVAIAAVYFWMRLAWVLMLVMIAIIIAVGLDPAVDRLERRGWPRWVAAWGLVALIVGTMIGFLGLTWSSLLAQAHNLGDRLTMMEQDVLARTPPALLDLVRRSGDNADASMVAPYIVTIGRSALNAAAAFVLAWILVAYLLLEAEPTYRWVRGFVPERHRTRFDATARDAREVAFGFILGNVVTSICAGIYFFVWFTILGVPAALLLALLAFLCDFIPVVGFLLSCLPALAMAATRSPSVVLVVFALFLAYHFIENYIIAPRVYAGRLRLSNIAILLAFAVGAEIGGVVGAVLALPVAAVYPTIERHWLREPFGDDVIEEHAAVASDEPARVPRKRTA
jgi:predicted PurR-regulated permease PerM